MVPFSRTAERAPSVARRVRAAPIETLTTQPYGLGPPSPAMRARVAFLDAVAARRMRSVRRVRAALRELLQKHSLGTAAQRGWRESPRLVPLVQQARSLIR